MGRGQHVAATCAARRNRCEGRARNGAGANNDEGASGDWPACAMRKQQTEPAGLTAPEKDVHLPSKQHVRTLSLDEESLSATGSLHPIPSGGCVGTT